MVSESDLQRFRLALETELKVLLHNATIQDAILREVENPDEIDLADLHENQEIRSSLEEFNSDLIDQVERALARLDNGTYGICLKCKRLIPDERLIAIPYAELCVSCQSQLEGG